MGLYFVFFFPLILGESLLKAGQTKLGAMDFDVFPPLLLPFSLEKTLFSRTTEII